MSQENWIVTGTRARVVARQCGLSDLVRLESSIKRSCRGRRGVIVGAFYGTRRQLLEHMPRHLPGARLTVARPIPDAHKNA